MASKEKPALKDSIQPPSTDSGSESYDSDSKEAQAIVRELGAPQDKAPVGPAITAFWRRKKNRRVTAWTCVAFFALDLPRGNISQANTDNFLEDLGLITNDYNLGQTLFRTAFLLAELPSQLVSKKLGPDVWIPIQMIAWSCVSGSQFWLSGRTSFLVTRVLIAALQGGFIPDIILYLSYFFKSSELPFRLALFWMSMRMTDVVAPSLAAGILQSRGVEGQEGWRWLFLIEGILTFAIGFWSIFQMVPSITQTKARWRSQGWFSKREEKICVNRVLRDDPSKGDMHNREAITLEMLWQSLCDYDLWPVYALGITFGVAFTTQEQYYTLTLRGLDFNTLQSNSLTIPAQFGTTITILLCTAYSERFNQRWLFGIFSQVWMLPGTLALVYLPKSTGRWSFYAAVTVILCYPYPHPIHVAWLSRMSNTVRARTVSTALYNMAVQLSAIIAANIFREDDAPRYRRGNGVLAGFCGLTIALYVFSRGYYHVRNKQKRVKWNAMSPEEQKEYLDTTKDQGSRRLDFQFSY